MKQQATKTVDTEFLRIAYLEDGPSDGWPVILVHGYPYDVHAFEADAGILAAEGARVLRPYVRGYGPTRFLSDETRRNGQQAARALDVIQFSSALGLARPILGGFDWGGNACCVAAALWPDQVGGLVSYAGYDVIDVEKQRSPVEVSLERVCWYQHLFQTERGRMCLQKSRADIGRTLWREWSPNWAFDEETFERTAAAFDNPDFVDIVISAYRIMHGNERGDPLLQPLEDRLAQHPPIIVPSITIDGTADPLKPGGTADHAYLFTGPHEHRSLSVGHNVPQEAPGEFAKAVLKIRRGMVD
ncbi:MULTISPECIES: alpha/beta fold hydrolase [Nitrospirillum]|uniref:Pimeloyl-ACP methyl ester carboxylesterase n=1 Tax=Nitrospirillum amazonense TaxID=28077 RepID=A0A560G984_9PROT|nr:alpha/beta hydrolase [Nitrospirillum amazonense]MEC4591788.1 alpha/beta hydrolase [Nitrospirillum amazonense]TWB30463.1 pimeloyl-ACP methyl ester carboxylesterase [Nitrospirillum amazonense]